MDQKKMEMSAPRRFRGIRKQVNAFLLTALAGFAGVVGLVAYKQGVFVKHTQIHFHAPDATGINKGMPVRLHGVPVGAVADIQLADRGARVRLGINNNYVERVPRGAQARLAREGYVGVASIQILPGGTDRTPVAEGDEIRFIAQKGIADMLDEVRQQMTPALVELRRAGCASWCATPTAPCSRSAARRKARSGS
jgi:ABC-type transporter Mla subunit MlaD